MVPVRCRNSADANPPFENGIRLAPWALIRLGPVAFGTARELYMTIPADPDHPAAPDATTPPAVLPLAAVTLQLPNGPGTVSRSLR